MIATLKKDAKVLVPNKEHKNFTETSEVIPAGTELEGDFKSIRGERRGEPFSFRVFITNDGRIIYSNNVKEMKATEVMLGADSSATPTRVNFLPAETFKTSRVVVSLAAGIGAYMYAKKKGKKAVKWAVIGAAVGYAAVWAFDRTQSAVVTPSK